MADTGEKCSVIIRQRDAVLAFKVHQYSRFNWRPKPIFMLRRPKDRLIWIATAGLREFGCYPSRLFNVLAQGSHFKIILDCFGDYGDPFVIVQPFHLFAATTATR